MKRESTPTAHGASARIGLALAGLLFFIVAFGLAGMEVSRMGPSTPGGLALVVGLLAAAIFALAAGWGLGRPVETGGGEARLIGALGEAAAIAAADGRLTAFNPAWRNLAGEARRLPKGAGAAGLFEALSAARRGEPGEVTLRLGGAERRLRISALDSGHVLLRLVEAPAAPVVQLAASPGAQSAPVSSVPVTALDAFAVAAPFGAALLAGEEVFSAQIVQTNAALSALSGGRAAPGMAFGELIDPETRLDAGLGMSEGRSGPFEVRLAQDKTRIAHLYISRAGETLVAYLLDVSAQKQMEMQLVQSQKMQAIGQLAGGVAHDFNNLLSALQLRLDELLHRHPVGDPSYEGLNEIRQTGVRAADLVRKLLAFSRKQTVQREVLELGELISEFEVLLRRLMREDVRLVTEYGRDLPRVRADKSQLETAVMNLAVNARDAVRAAKGSGEVRIRTARLSHGEAVGLGYAGPPGALALIEVSDDGPGIPEEVMGKIFDPFFTTKPVGEGTGLGLATVYGIIKQSDGWIHVASKPGEGAAFRIFLPIYAAPAAAAPEPPKPKPAARDLSGAGRILFVEDEDSVRSVAARLLRARGYEVIEACDGEEALTLAKEHAGAIDLLISDVIMPGIDGPTLLKKARVYLGTAPVMFISGYAEAEFSDLLEGERGVTFLPKPIDIKVLAERVKQQLQAA